MYFTIICKAYIYDYCAHLLGFVMGLTPASAENTKEKEGMKGVIVHFRLFPTEFHYPIALTELKSQPFLTHPDKCGFITTQNAPKPLLGGA